MTVLTRRFERIKRLCIFLIVQRPWLLFQERPLRTALRSKLQTNEKNILKNNKSPPSCSFEPVIVHNVRLCSLNVSFLMFFPLCCYIFHCIPPEEHSGQTLMLDQEVWGEVSVPVRPKSVQLDFNCVFTLWSSFCAQAHVDVMMCSNISDHIL